MGLESNFPCWTSWNSWLRLYHLVSVRIAMKHAISSQPTSDPMFAQIATVDQATCIMMIKIYVNSISESSVGIRRLMLNIMGSFLLSRFNLHGSNGSSWWNVQQPTVIQYEASSDSIFKNFKCPISWWTFSLSLKLWSFEAALKVDLRKFLHVLFVGDIFSHYYGNESTQSIERSKFMFKEIILFSHSDQLFTQLGSQLNGYWMLWFSSTFQPSTTYAKTLPVPMLSSTHNATVGR